MSTADDWAKYSRFAIYYAPRAQSALAQFAHEWFAGDLPEWCDLPTAVYRRAIQSPSKYGIHGTLKAPFRLSDGGSLSELDARLERFAAHRAPLSLQPLELRAIGDFLALCPRGDITSLNRLATAAVLCFDDFRAAPNEPELARRLASPLSRDQKLLLNWYGYPYILNEFRFHITLSGRLDEGERERVAAAIEPRLSKALNQDFYIEDVCLFGDPGGGERFEILKRYGLAR